MTCLGHMKSSVPYHDHSLCFTVYEMDREVMRVNECLDTSGISDYKGKGNTNIPVIKAVCLQTVSK